MIVVYWFRNPSPSRMDPYFRKLQLASAAWFSLSFGSNDARKSAGMIHGVLYTSHYLTTFEIPAGVLLAAYLTIALGKLSGGWRIMHTMAGRLPRLQPRSGFGAESGAALAVAGAIIGVGMIERMKAAGWGIATHIVRA